MKGLCCKISPITLLSCEEIILNIIAKKLDIKVKIDPGYLVFDRKSNRYIALSYILNLNNGKCPFLKDNKCLLHDIYKPLICRAFPYIPREVKYLYNDSLKILIAKVNYGLSMKCPVINNDQEYLNTLFNLSPSLIAKYMPDEYLSALEMERKRSIILSLLSSLWQQDIVDLVPNKNNINNNYNRVLNVYELLRKYYPNLPYRLGIYKTLHVLRKLAP